MQQWKVLSIAIYTHSIAEISVSLSHLWKGRFWSTGRLLTVFSSLMAWAFLLSFFFFFLLQWRASALFQWILIEKKWLTTTFKMLGGSWGSHSTFPELRGDSSGRAWMPAVEQDTTAAWQVRVSSPRTPTAGQTNCAPNPADCYRRLAGRHWWDVADVWN